MTLVNTLPSVSAVKTKNIILLHGLFGSLSNWNAVQKFFSKNHNIYAPEIPINSGGLLGKNPLELAVDYIALFIKENNLAKVTLIGNSLGGHIALLYTLKYPEKVEKLVLTGSSGLYENSFNGSFPKVKDYNYIKDRVYYTFQNQSVVTKSLVDDVFKKVQDTSTALSIIRIARSAQKNNLAKSLHLIKAPTLLIWGLQDKITPISTAYEFYEGIPNARIHILNECGHVPMMEQPLLFNEFLEDFLNQ